MGQMPPSDGGPDGALFGQSSTDRVGFYGLTTPIAQPTITAVGTTTATTTLSETKVDRLYAALLSLGLINTGG